LNGQVFTVEFRTHRTPHLQQQTSSKLSEIILASVTQTGSSQYYAPLLGPSNLYILNAVRCPYVRP